MNGLIGRNARTVPALGTVGLGGEKRKSVRACGCGLAGIRFPSIAPSGRLIGFHGCALPVQSGFASAVLCIMKIYISSLEA